MYPYLLHKGNFQSLWLAQIRSPRQRFQPSHRQVNYFEKEELCSTR